MSNNTPYAAADLIRNLVPAHFKPRVALILGSGLGELAEQVTDVVSVNFDALPGFPISTVHGHAGELVLGTLSGVPVACMKGRGHFYEGYGMGVMTSAIRTLKLLGCEMLFVTNAAGSLRLDVDAGALVALTDHINFLPGTPLIGANDERFGPRFFSMANAYDSDLRCLLQQTAAGADVKLHEGVFIACPGPNFETAAEIRAMARLGADVVGMSVVPEVISARHCGIKVVALSVITNLAEGLGDVELSHEQTLKYAALGSGEMATLILGFLTRVAQMPAVARVK
jgi:xanthosine phosphorylase